MRVVALTRTSAVGPSTRYRVLQYRPALAQRGIQVQVRALFGPTWFALLERRPGLLTSLLKAGYSLLRLAARTGQVLSARISRPDLVLIEQQLFPYLPAWVELLLWPRATPTAVEFDDAIHLTPGHGAKLPRLWARADLVIVGNRFLRDAARAHARRIEVIPTTLDLGRYEQALELQRGRRDQPAEPGAPLRVGWIGLRYNFPFLSELAPALAALPGGATLVVISSGLPQGPEWAGICLEHRPWSEATEAADLASCDVGIMPLPDTPWARGKCALKLLQCMAAGVPVVASPVGVNADIIRPGENGLLATTGAQWTAAMQALASDPELRSRLGEAGRQTVQAGFSLERGAELLAKAYGFASFRADGGTGTDPHHPPPTR